MALDLLGDVVRIVGLAQRQGFLIQLLRQHKRNGELVRSCLPPLPGKSKCAKRRASHESPLLANRSPDDPRHFSPHLWIQSLGSNFSYRGWKGHTTSRTPPCVKESNSLADTYQLRARADVVGIQNEEAPALVG